MGEGAGQLEIGGRLRSLRKWRGKSLQVVAELTGHTKGWLSRIETGKIPLQRPDDIAALARVLEVSPADLTGRYVERRPPSPVDPLVPAIRVALVDGVADVPVRPLDDLAARVQRASAALWTEGDFAEVAADLPDLFAALRVVCASGDEQDRRRALRLLAVLASLAFPMLKNLDHTDLALLAASRCSEAARELGEPMWEAYAEFRRSHALIPAGAPLRALQISRSAADALDAHASTDTARRMLGMLHLTAALWAGRAGHEAAVREHLAESDRIAARVGDGEFYDIWFGPTQLAVHRVGIAATLGDGGATPQLARLVDGRAIRSRVHRAFLAADVGRGLGQVRGREHDAIGALRRAERLAPQRILSSRLIHAVIGDLLGRPMSKSDERELRGMAYRAGVPH